MGHQAFIGIDRSHPIFSRHRFNDIRYDTVLSFPPGSGGNFLTMRGTVRPANGSINSFIGRGAHHLFMDDIPWDQPLDLDVLDESLLADPGLPMPHHRIGRCHNLPWLTMMVFQARIDELVSLMPGADGAWFCNALNKIKWLCNSDANSQPDMVYQLLHDARHDGPVDIGMYRLLCDTVINRFGMDYRYTVLSWRHYMECRTRGIPVNDPGFLAEMVARNVFPTLLENISGIPDHYTAIWRGTTYAAQMSELRGMVGRFTEVGYMELMLDGDLGGSAFLGSLDRDAIAVYTAGNIDIVRKWLRCCDPSVSDRGMAMLDVMEHRLSRSASR